MRLLDKIKEIIYIDRFVSEHRAEEEHRILRGASLISALAFTVMSLVNLQHHAVFMLCTTALSAVALMVGYLIARFKNNHAALRGIVYAILVIVFTAYAAGGGNAGFSVLWIILATYAAMISVNLKVGFAISVYYFFMLIMVFGPLSSLFEYNYDEMFTLRFPYLYAINVVLATYIAICLRRCQYQLLLKQEELELLNSLDLSTGLLNRNRFIKDASEFSAEGIETLAAVFIDVNGLHEINNREGHGAGDQMLREVAEMCKEHFKGHTVYRMGGDEFLAVCKNTGEHAVTDAARALAEGVVRMGYSISYGIETQESEFDLDMIVKKSDEKMIKSKKEYYRLRAQSDELCCRD